MQLGYETAKQFKQQAKLLADDMDGHGWKYDTIVAPSKQTDSSSDKRWLAGNQTSR
jgi:hypothetical protein